MYHRQTHTKPQGAHRRPSYRIKGYDYSSPGYYYGTICTMWHRHYFGDIVDGKVQLHDIGSIVQAMWVSLPERFPGVALDQYVIMPNHIHGILVLPDEYPLEIFAENKAWTRPSFGAILRAFKAVATYHIRRTTTGKGFAWQPNYYDRVVRNDVDLYRIRKYIIDNPLNWQHDEYRGQ